MANNDTKALRSEAQNFNQQIHNSKDYSPRPSSNLKLPSDENTAANDASTKMKDPDQNNTKLLSKQKLGELLSWVDPSGKLDPNVEEVCILCGITATCAGLFSSFRLMLSKI